MLIWKFYLSLSLLLWKLGNVSICPDPRSVKGRFEKILKEIQFLGKGKVRLWRVAEYATAKICYVGIETVFSWNNWELGKEMLSAFPLFA